MTASAFGRPGANLRVGGQVDLQEVHQVRAPKGVCDLGSARPECNARVSFQHGGHAAPGVCPLRVPMRWLCLRQEDSFPQAAPVFEMTGRRQMGQGWCRRTKRVPSHGLLNMGANVACFRALAQGFAMRWCAIEITHLSGAEHVPFDRRHKGWREIGGDVVVHSAVGGALRARSRMLQSRLQVDTTARRLQGLSRWEPIGRLTVQPSRRSDAG